MYEINLKHTQDLLDEAAGLGWDLAATSSKIFLKKIYILIILMVFKEVPQHWMLL